MAQDDYRKLSSVFVNVFNIAMGPVGMRLSLGESFGDVANWQNAFIMHHDCLDLFIKALVDQRDILRKRMQEAPLGEQSEADDELLAGAEKPPGPLN